MSRSLAIATRGHETVCPEGGGGVGPGRPCIMLEEVVGNTIKFSVVPPPDIDYAGTIIQYNEVNTCSGYVETGPEDPGGFIEINGVPTGRIHAFIPYAYDVDGNLGKPGNVILATVPINIIDMDQLQLNGCGLEDIWRMIESKVNASELSNALRTADLALQAMSEDRRLLQERVTRLQAEIAILRRKL